MFYGAGSASLGYPSEEFGGIVYGYTESEVLIWTPTGPSGHLIYINGVWGDGIDSMHVDTVEITIKIIHSYISECASPPDIVNAVKVYNGVRNGSLVSYCCLPGYVSSGEFDVLPCNALATSEVLFSSVEEIVRDLKIPKRNTSSYDRSLMCAFDPRQSSMAVRSVGVVILFLVAALLNIADIHTFLEGRM
ncbi:uncharacterized protein LOC134277797 [Saccostrea cucullata]|uniref:uncharacterized protein LOC134277797 n=1 Tax=Saccostrea cuccullata TaxID=36930 RepID=UPI002ED006F8